MTKFLFNLSIKSRQQLLEKAVTEKDWNTALSLAEPLSHVCLEDCLTLAFIYHQIDDQAGVDAAINLARSTWPTNAMPVIWMATNQLDRREYDLAHQTLMEITPGCDQIALLYHSLKSVIFSNVNDHESALTSALKALSLADDAETKEKIECQIASYYYSLCQPELCIEKLLSVLKVNPKSIQAIMTMTKVYVDGRRWTELLAFLDQFHDYHHHSARANQLVLRTRITCQLELRDYLKASNGIMNLATVVGDDDFFVLRSRQRLLIANQQYLQNINNLNSLIKK